MRSMFDRIAPHYDLLNRVLSAGTDVRWRRRAVDYLELGPPLRVLDLCTGTADLLIDALQRDGRSQGLGVDLSQGMLQRGAAKLRRAGLRFARAAVRRRRRAAAGEGRRLRRRAGGVRHPQRR